MTKSKAADPAKGYRDRQGETLFIDARNLGTMISRTTKELTAEDIATIADTYHAGAVRRKNWLHGLRVVTASGKNMKTGQAFAKLRPCKILKITTTY